jgi:Cys-tRNA(Pro)/Cys-tRNA(Cys) deacylase
MKMLKLHYSKLFQGTSKMNNKLKQITKKLEEMEIEYNLIKLKDRAMTVQQVIEFSDKDINPDEICKTLVLKDKQDKTYAVFLVGDQRVSFGKVRKIFDCSKLRMASPNEIKRETGLEIGAVCPLFLKLPLVIDKRVFTRKKVNFGSGDHLYGIEIDPKDIMKCTKAKISDIVDN